MTIGILLVAHGSPVPAANEEVRALLPLVQQRSGYALVEHAFLEGAAPSVPEGIAACVVRGATSVVIVPYFLLLGKHVAEDLPALVEQARGRHPHMEIVLGRHLGDHPLLGEIVWERMKASRFFDTLEQTE